MVRWIDAVRLAQKLYIQTGGKTKFKVYRYTSYFQTEKIFFYIKVVY